MVSDVAVNAAKIRRCADSTSIAASVANNEPYLLLLTMLRLETRERRREGRERSQSSGVAARTGLPRSQQEALAATIFGRETSSTNRSDAQNRFLKSWMETAYPEHGERR